jgi:hypothetical protein
VGAIRNPIRLGTAGTLQLETLEVQGGNGFRAEAESFVRMMRGEQAHWNSACEAESIGIVLALDAIATSARSGGWEAVGAKIRQP